jgi:hypothetical protein
MRASGPGQLLQQTHYKGDYKDPIQFRALGAISRAHNIMVLQLIIILYKCCTRGCRVWVVLQ